MCITDATATRDGGSLPARAATGHVSPHEKADIVARELPADLIAWNLPLVPPWPSASPVLSLAIAALPAVEDVIAARLIERMSLTIVDLSEQLASTRYVLSEALTHTREQQLIIDRLHGQVIAMREERRAERKAAA